MLARGACDAALASIYERHAGAAFSLAYRIVGERSLAEEITQEAFLSIWRSAEGYRAERGSVSVWVLGIVHHRAIDMLRRRCIDERWRATGNGFQAEAEATERTDAEVIRRGDAGDVRYALATLPADQRQAIELAYFGGYTHAQIAERLHLPLGTVKGRMRLGLDKLRARLGHPAG